MPGISGILAGMGLLTGNSVPARAENREFRPLRCWELGIYCQKLGILPLSVLGIGNSARLCHKLGILPLSVLGIGNVAPAGAKSWELGPHWQRERGIAGSGIGNSVRDCAGNREFRPETPGFRAGSQEFRAETPEFRAGSREFRAEPPEFRPQPPGAAAQAPGRGAAPGIPDPVPLRGRRPAPAAALPRVPGDAPGRARVPERSAGMRECGMGWREWECRDNGTGSG